MAVETHGGVVLRAYPKSRAGVRAVPMPPFLVDELRQQGGPTSPDGRALVFADRDGGPQRRSNFRRRVWLPSLVRAGLLGRVTEVAPGRWMATWPDRDGREQRAEFRRKLRRWRTRRPRRSADCGSTTFGTRTLPGW
ncbi:hypothetical protein ACFY1S_12645 [Micromonospora sp. NPDC000663]|uniref:hypothetical protein n=1 Tax=Micromonospora sp. NPDC000663 TaxID=3364218 RepID=UPI0036906044